MLAALFAVVGLDRRGLSGLIPEGPVFVDRGAPARSRGEPPRPPAVAGGHGTGQDAGSCRQRELGAPLR
jgi:hypothetical protein